MARDTILVVEDDPDIVELLRYNLEREGFDVRAVGDGESGLAAAETHQPALILLDLMLPGMEGLEVCRELRRREPTSAIPLIMLTAKGDEADIVLGLGLGADDYVTKPFSPRELALRVSAILRRSNGERVATGVLERGPLLLDGERHRCTVAGDEIQLTAKEFRLLEALMSRPGRVLSRQRLLDEVWGSDITVTERTIDTHLKRLREKLGPAGDQIETVRGVGYRFAE